MSKETQKGTSERQYERTHSWLTFKIDLNKLNYRLWMNLGAIQSKCEHVAHVMVAPDVGKRLLSLYLAKGVAATTAIEGNTLTEKEVLRRIKTKKPLPESREYLGKEIDNIVEACNLAAKEMISDGLDCTITPDRVKWFNQMVLRDLATSEDVEPGKIRKHSVGVDDYRGAPPQDCEYLLRKMCDWINSLKSDHDRIAIAVIRAILAHVYLAWIHPFGDGNGRTARLVEFQIFLGAGMPTVACHLLSNHYNKTRAEYYRQLSMASKKSDVLPFIQYAVQGLVDQLDEQIKQIREYQHSVVWKDHVYEKFRDKKSAAAHRRRQLALELGKQPKKHLIRSLDGLSPEMSAAYSGKTRKTITRDVNALSHMGLVARGKHYVQSNKASLKAFMPGRRAESRRQ